MTKGFGEGGFEFSDFEFGKGELAVLIFVGLLETHSRWRRCHRQSAAAPPPSRSDERTDWRRAAADWPGRAAHSPRPHPAAPKNHHTLNAEWYANLPVRCWRSPPIVGWCRAPPTHGLSAADAMQMQMRAVCAWLMAGTALTWQRWCRRRSTHSRKPSCSPIVRRCADDVSAQRSRRSPPLF